MKVIVIDDDQDTLDVFCEYLSLKNIQVLGRGHNGRDAVDLYRKLKPDIVLLDVMMPEYDGFFGLRNIRAFDPNAKVIMVTADLTSDTEKKLEELQASAVLYKPYEIDNVVETITKVHNNSIAISAKN